MAQELSPMACPPTPPTWPDSTTIKVRIGKFAPPGGRSAGHRGKGQVHLSAGGGIELTGKVVYGHPHLCALGATLVTTVVIRIVAQVTGFAIGPGLVIWWIIFDAIFQRPLDVQMDTQGGSAVYLPKKRAVCMQLQDGTWVTIQVGKKEIPGFFAQVQSVFGERMRTM